jgi:hypothetical protein
MLERGGDGARHGADNLCQLAGLEFVIAEGGVEDAVFRLLNRRLARDLGGREQLCLCGVRHLVILVWWAGISPENLLVVRRYRFHNCGDSASSSYVQLFLTEKLRRQHCDGMHRS